MSAAAGLGLGSPALATESLSFPFRMLRGRPWTSIAINGQAGAHAFLISSSSNSYAISTAKAEALKLPRITTTERQAAVGRVDMPIFRADSVIVGGALRERETYFGGVSDEFLDGFTGILPTARYLVFGLDYDSQAVTVANKLDADPEGFARLDIEMPAERVTGLNRLGNAAHMPVDQAQLSIRPIVVAELDGQPIRLLLDTATDAGLFLYPDTVRRRGLWDHYKAPRPAAFVTAAGLADARLVRAERLKIANVVFQTPVIMLGNPKDANRDGVGIAEGIVGMEFLRRLNFTFDRQKRRVWLRPNKAIGDGYRYDRAGLGVQPVGAAALVTFVAADGPASRAGLREGDRIIAWRGRESLTGLAWALRGAPGSAFDLEADRAGQPVDARFELVEPF